MAKPRKLKPEDQKSEPSSAILRHQKLCLCIDFDSRRIFGFTELEIALPDTGIVALHASNLAIERVTVDGEPVEFDHFSHFQEVESEKRWSSIDNVCSAADAASATYISALERESNPNLIIKCEKSLKLVNEQAEKLNSENGGIHSSSDIKQNVKLVRVDYWVEGAETGIHFNNNVLHTDNQIRRAHCWFPCIDSDSQRSCYDLEFTVAENLVAVSTGSLLHQVLSNDDPPRKTYVYRIKVPVSARWISLVVAPFEILPDQHSGVISHMCLPGHMQKLQNTVNFFHSAFSHYEVYLSASFPFESYKQVFIPPEMAVTSLSSGASISIFGSQILFDERIIDQTIETRIKLASALARQWFGVYITAEAPNDEWLLDGLAGFLTDSFIKSFLGNNEARYRRYKANCAVCKADDSGATALSSSAASKDLHGTQCIGLYGKIRSWKSVAVLQMLEKQMGPEAFRRILQKIVSDAARSSRTLSTKEFRHLANKVGNLERPFLKEFFPRWVGWCGCPVLRMGFSYNKRKNIVELASLRGCTSLPDSGASYQNGNLESENQEGAIGWPGMMSIRVYEFDGMYDHPILPMTGDSWQLLEIQCHSKLAAKRIQKPKKGSKPDGSDDNGDVIPADIRSNVESPLLWLRADPEVEYLAEIHFNQPVYMWINQLEKDKDVVAQAQAIETLEALPKLSFAVLNALNNFLGDSKAFWRVRIEAAFALANTASEETDWAGLVNLVKFYKSRRFDASIGLPRPNDFHDFPEYFVLEAIPHAIAMVRTPDKKSPREAVEFVLQLLKYNDNSGNPYSDVFWLAALVQSIGELEFGQQSILFLSSLLKRIDRLLQFDRLMPSHNGILTVSCIRTLTQVALKLSGFIPLDRVFELVKPFRDSMTAWQVQVEASRALLDLEFHCRGIDAALLMFMKYLEEEPSLKGQVKLCVHAMRLCQMKDGSESDTTVKSSTLVSLLCLLESRLAYNNIVLRHHLFCILQILAGRPPTLYGVPRVHKREISIPEIPSAPKDNFVPLTAEPSVPNDNFVALAAEPSSPKENFVTFAAESSVPKDNFAVCAAEPQPFAPLAVPSNNIHESVAVPEVSRDADTVSNSQERRKPPLKIRVKQSASSRAEGADNPARQKSHGGHADTERGPSSSMSVDAPQRNVTEAASISNQNFEEVNSCYDHGSRMTASIGSAKLGGDGDELGKELQCTADSSKVLVLPKPDDRASLSIIKGADIDADAQKFVSLRTLSVPRHDTDGASVASGEHHSREKDKEKKKKDREKKRKRDEHKGHHDDPEYLERKRLKKEKKQKEKELAKLLSGETKAAASAELPKGREIAQVRSQEVKMPPFEMQSEKEQTRIKLTPIHLKPKEPSGSKVVIKRTDTKPEASEGSSSHKLRIKIKNRTLDKS